MELVDLQQWKQDPVTKWFRKKLEECYREAMAAPCLDLENPYRTQAQRAYNEGMAEAFRQALEMGEEE